MKIRELFTHDVTRNIPPVVYFHEQSPERLAAEVYEYIVTGGYPPDDPRHRRVPDGIHEAYVKLLTRIRVGVEAPHGTDLPASWISGFYGSGKSSFAKLLGLALDGVQLPDGETLAEALLRRDDAPRARELRDAWQALASRIHARAVVFDIGGVARDDEHVHVAALRQVQKRLGYCPRSNQVAEFELMLETDGRWEDFLRTAVATLGKPWPVAMHEALAEEHFSHVLHALDPTRYVEPMSWIDARAGARTGAGTSVSEVVDAVGRMLSHRAADATLFLVIDEVSQYIHQDEGRMLKLQSLVSELGQRLRGKVWLLATGQQKLEDQSETHVLGKLKDRFPPALRVHLTNSNIRDVVHKRLLQKRSDREGELQSLFRQHRADLKLHGLDCESISEHDFVEVYPMLPGHVELLLQITSSLRLRSSRAQGDDQTLRGLLQLLGELFRERQLADKPVGALVTLDEIYEVQRTALDVDLQNSLARVHAHDVVAKNPLAWRVARVVSLLQQIQDQRPTTDELIARCLYDTLGQGSLLASVRETLEALQSENLVAYSEKHGFKIQSAAGQEWQRERDEIGVTRDVISGIVRDQLKSLLAMPERPRLKGRPFAWSAWFSDEQYLTGEHLASPRAQDTESTVDLRLLWSRERRAHERWVVESDQGELRDRVIWVSSDPEHVEHTAREYARSKRMVGNYEVRRSSLSHDGQRLLLEEETRLEELERRVRDRVSEVLLLGTMWFRGRPIKPKDAGHAFGSVLLAVAEDALPKLYPSFTDIAILPKELEQLLHADLGGPSAKFLDGTGLGILSMDGGRYVPSCTGAIPTGILQALENAKGLTGTDILAQFVRPPTGWPADVVKACLAGLLRGSKIIVQPAQGARMTSVRDVGVNGLFTNNDRDFRLASFFPAREGDISPRDRTAICRLFQERLGADLDRENDAIADGVWAHFPKVKSKLQEVEQRLRTLDAPLPDTLIHLSRALEKSQASRRVEDVVLSLKQSLDALRDGIDSLAALHTNLTDPAVAQVREARSVAAEPLAQLVAADMLDDVGTDADKLRAQLALPTPWNGIADVRASVDRIRKRYQSARGELLTQIGAHVEGARTRLQARQGFAALGADESHAVLRPFQRVIPDAARDALRPTLEDLRERFPERLRRAEDEANHLLDEALAATREVPVHPMKLELRGRELATEEDLDALLSELRSRILAQLKRGVRVRLD